jgi:hypothetical protein
MSATPFTGGGIKLIEGEADCAEARNIGRTGKAPMPAMNTPRRPTKDRREVRPAINRIAPVV